MRPILLLAVLALLVIFVWPWLKRAAGPDRVPPARRRDELVKDPVCQTYVLASRAVRREVEGAMCYFCSPECAARFLEGERRA
ncbi:MAG: hypothetical protein L0027_13485 [Candidatus Rokubacteria bacterium]|nr:hypothetical protein [Candidatus Rokubacteria bacterium]